MKVFLSYRRDDTAGRAGRLRDGLVARLGHGNVFHDVGSVAPGNAFDRAILEALEASDAALVVIGQTWTSAVDGTGRRRLDDPDDWVRREVTAALQTGQPVVPVLVGRASLPAADELPPDLRPLVSRQAVILDDDTWHQDLDNLMERLRRPAAATRAGFRITRRRALVGVLLAAVAVAGTGVVLLDGRGEDEGAGSEGLPSCPTADGSWTQLVVRPGSTVLDPLPETDSAAADDALRYTVEAARVRPQGDRYDIVVDVEVAFEGASPGRYIGGGDFQRPVVNGHPLLELSCLGPADGDQQLLPGQKVTLPIGFRTTEQPLETIAIETISFQQLVVISP